jgi:hypothetical protein
MFEDFFPYDLGLLKMKSNTSGREYRWVKKQTNRRKKFKIEADNIFREE